MPSAVLAFESSEDEILKCIICTVALEDAVLLSCLHSVCRSCTAGDVTASITCPLCQVTTDTPTAKANLLVTSLAHRSLVLNDVFSCTLCIDEDKDDATAVAWCYTCQHSLCIDCQKYQSRLHSTHKVMHLNEQTNLSDLYRPPVRTCTEHDEELKFACFTCKDGRCYRCAHDCYTSSHDVLPLDGAVALKRMNDSVTQASTVLSDLNSVLTMLQAHLSLPEKVCSAREESIAMLKRAKKTAIDLISKAYENAEECLLECWDALVAKSLGLRESAERLKTRLDWTNKYCQLALNSNDVAGLLPQLSAVFSSARALLEEARPFKEPVDPLKLVRVNVCLPADLDLIASGWFGVPKVVSDDFSSVLTDFTSEDSIDYYTRKVATLKELEQLLQNQKEQQQNVQHERQSMEKLKSQVTLQDQQLVSAQKKLDQLLKSQKEQQELLRRERQSLKQLNSEVTLKDQQLASVKGNLKQLRQQQTEQKEQLERAGKTLEKERAELTSVKQQLESCSFMVKVHRTRTAKQVRNALCALCCLLAASQNEVRQLREQEKEQQKRRERERSQLEQLQSEFRSQMQQLAAFQNEVKQLREQEKEQQEHRRREQRALQQLQLERQHLAPSRPLLFDDKPRGTFIGPGSCWDVAVTSQGRLLVAALDGGLKEYDATSFHEITAWKPVTPLGGKGVLGVTTVAALADGKALVGIQSRERPLVGQGCNEVALLRRDVGSGGNADAWQVERYIVILRAPPRRLSAWGDSLLAVLEDRYDDRTRSWRCGSGLVLLSLSECAKQLHRQELDYDALSVALTDRGIVVTSEDEVELTDAVDSGGGSRKSYVVDCYSHVGVRLWRHVVSGGLKVRSVCSDSVGRAVYAAKRHGSIVALSIDDGRELCTAISINAKVTESSYAIDFDNVTRRLLALISFDGDRPNRIAVFSVA